LPNTWRKDLAVHVSLSSDSIVKQQVGTGLTPNSETLSIPTKKAGYKNPRSSGEASASAAQWRRRRRWARYRSTKPNMSTRVFANLTAGNRRCSGKASIGGVRPGRFRHSEQHENQASQRDNPFAMRQFSQMPAMSQTVVDPPDDLESLRAMRRSKS
jgi:hypothetical protein